MYWLNDILIRFAYDIVHVWMSSHHIYSDHFHNFPCFMLLLFNLDNCFEWMDMINDFEFIKNVERAVINWHIKSHKCIEPKHGKCFVFNLLPVGGIQYTILIGKLSSIQISMKLDNYSNFSTIICHFIGKFELFMI